MTNKEKSKIAYDKKADDYNNTYDGRFTEKFKNLLMQKLEIEENNAILDVGCGNGTLLSRISQLKPIKGFGTDISPQMIKNATMLCPDFNFAVSDCENIPFDDNSMDIIIACASYHHFPNVKAFALEAKRLLKTGGSIYIAEIYLPPVIRNIANIFLPFSRDGDVKFYSAKEIIKNFYGCGFKSQKVVQDKHIQIIKCRSIQS